MQFFLIQRLVDMLLGIVLWRCFAPCHSLMQGLQLISDMDPLKQIGVLTASIILATSAGNLARAAWGAFQKVIAWVRSLFK